MGTSTQIFCRIGKNSQCLVPIVLAKEVLFSIPEMGQFCLLDSESSLNKGVIIQREDFIEILNEKINPQSVQSIKEGSLNVTEVPLSEKTLDFGEGMKITLKNQNSEKHKPIDLLSGERFSINLVFS